MDSEHGDDLRGIHYHDALRRLHAWRRPATYVEICSGRSDTLALAEGRCVLLNVGRPLHADEAQPGLHRAVAQLRMTSAEFFRVTDLRALLGGPVEFALIDGLHVCEVVLAEFLALEKASARETLIVLHDCLPVEPAIAERSPRRDQVRAPHRRDWWIGDVWRAALYLKRHRPDLVLRTLDARPTGLLCVTNCDSARAPTDLEGAKREMLGYDLAAIGIAGLAAELGVVSTEALSAEADLGALFAPPQAAPAADAGAIAAGLRAAAPHGLVAATLRNARLQVFRGSALRFKGGPVLDADERLTPLRHFRGPRVMDSFEPASPPLPLLQGEFIYGGPLYFHFGHFMAEMVHRVIPSLQTFGAGRFLFIAEEGRAREFDQLPGWMRGIFATIGLSRDNVAFLNSDCVAETLHVCQQGATLGREPFPGYLAVLRDFWRLRGAPPAPTHRRIYVSRSKIVHGGNFLGEGYVDGMFRKAGYHIMHPEQLGFAEQVGLYLNAEELVFCEGSSCHGCELIGEAMLGRVMLIGKREISTFTGVLRPRSREFHVKGGNHTLGTLILDPATGEPFIHLGLHLLDLPGFLDTMRDSGFGDMEPFLDLDAYRKAAQDDLYRYVTHYLDTRPYPIAPGRIAGLMESFERLLPASLGRLGT